MKNRIKEIRKTVGLNQIEFGAKIGVKGNTIGNYEVGLRNPSDAVIFSICREFNVNEEWLRTGNGEMFIHMDREDELSAWAGSILNPNNDNEFMKKFVHMLSKLKEDDWKVLEKMALLMSEENKEG
ncbi:helix-turn-helix transcriptional regulator [Anaerocolumna chitinilytica]|uniref:HTH cro/C1-type domain-containing protein n=1 Tax=Anaerocolumna chitinilytica TaxID=1727145 RepID=A0A7M3SA26_9FIRM|nr:helix-turn-helix transcriptional regulator [Anaerocolumna chitinilytica]BCK01444.1 hypothetical protein bsdcttw_44840 [Anaerocolumna chitinilytica]